MRKFKKAIIVGNTGMDTHPDDNEINEKLNAYKEKSAKLREEYERMYGPITPSSEETNRWGWISDPWPWNNASEGDEN